MTDLMIRREEVGLRCHRSLVWMWRCTEWRYRGITAPRYLHTDTCHHSAWPTAWSCHLRLSSRKYCSVQQTRSCYESSAAVVLALVILHYCVQQYNMDYIAEMQTPGLSQTNIYKSSKIYVDCRLCVWTIILVCLGLSHPIFSECFLEVQSCFTAHFLEVPDVLFISLQHENLLGAKLLELGPGRAARIRKYKCDSRDIFRRSGKKGRNCDWHFGSC